MERYENVLHQIETTRRFGNQPGVEVTAHMLEVMGHPEKGQPFIHVAGTNGKGSTCAFISRILQNMGLKVGSFTSPHLIDFTERISVNGVQIGKEDVIRIGEQLLNTEFALSPTMFDYCLLMAIIYFKEQGCDLLILETGLGGRLDSTNAVGIPKVCTITRIGYDHMSILGDTLAQIASEKAGIIKPGAAVAIAPQVSEALAVLKDASKHNDTIFLTEEDTKNIKAYQPNMNAKYQRENAALAEQTVRLLWKSGYLQKKTLKSDVDLEQAIAVGIRDAFWPGRMEVLSANPFFMVDGAHNSNGVQALKESLEEMFPNEKFLFVMGVMADKDYEEMIKCLLPLAKEFVTVTVDSERALTAEVLADLVKKQGVSVKALEKIEDIFTLSEESQKVIAMGSLYFIGDVKSLWNQKKQNAN